VRVAISIPILLFGFLSSLKNGPAQTSFNNKTTKSEINVYVGISLNLNPHEIYNQTMNSGVNPIPDYKEKIYLNSFRQGNFTYLTGLNHFFNDQIYQTLQIGFCKERYSNLDFTPYMAERVFRNFQLNYQINFFWLKTNFGSKGFAGGGLAFEKKINADDRRNIYNSNIEYRIIDKANLFSFHGALGFLFSKNRFSFQASTNPILLSYSKGDQSFEASSQSNTFVSEKTYYSIFQSIIEANRSRLLLQNFLQVKIGLSI
jgi:hypothetical protein